MNKNIIVQFVGFESNSKAREYTFTVKEPSTEPRGYILTIPHEAFNAHRVSYQDAPDVCSLKLHRELAAANSNQLEDTRLQITDADIEDYRAAHSPRPRPRFGHKPVHEF